MLIFELRKKGDAYELSGGKLESPLLYPEPDAIEYATRNAGFLASMWGGELRIYDEAGTLTATKVFREGVRPTKSELGNV